MCLRAAWGLWLEFRLLLIKALPARFLHPCAAVSARSLPAQQQPLASQLETLLLLLRAAAAAAALATVWATLSGMEVVRHLLLQRPWGQRIVRRFSMDGVSPKGQLCSTPPSRGSIKAHHYYQCHNDTPEKGAALDLEQPLGGSGGRPHLKRSATVLGEGAAWNASQDASATLHRPPILPRCRPAPHDLARAVLCGAGDGRPGRHLRRAARPGGDGAVLGAHGGGACGRQLLALHHHAHELRLPPLLPQVGRQALQPVPLGR